eukprot:TRINITY_DN70_c0_g1_i12.p1 TRINITY_DN70_c0_g1~~TRINITY_DN70_c0_g1_i12.p1  ORF type:complete len:149 (+),score=25.75 TRINITY_DN70_c0_g1_i12:969-1415(+)
MSDSVLLTFSGVSSVVTLVSAPISVPLCSSPSPHSLTSFPCTAYDTNRATATLPRNLHTCIQHYSLSLSLNLLNSPSGMVVSHSTRFYPYTHQVVQIFRTMVQQSYGYSPHGSTTPSSSRVEWDQITVLYFRFKHYRGTLTSITRSAT